MIIFYEDNFKTMDLSEKLWWAYKALIKQIEHAEAGKDIEGYFARQELEFGNGDSFRTEEGSAVTESMAAVTENEPGVKKGSLIITAGGDLSCSDVISPESTLHLWDEVEDFYMTGDIVCANLESPVDPSKPAKKLPAVCLTAPALNTTPEMFERYARGGSGINFFSTANNHSLDQGEDGLLATLEFLDSKGCMHVGTSRTSGE